MNIPTIMETERAKIRPFYPIPVAASYPRGVPTKDGPATLPPKYLSIYQPAEDIWKEELIGEVVLTESTMPEILEMMENMGQPFCLIEEPLDDGTIQYTHVNLQWKVR